MKRLLLTLYFSDTMTTRYWSIWVMVIAAVGVALRRDDPTEDIALLFAVAPWWAWSSLLFVLALYRFFGLIDFGMTMLTSVMIPATSLCIWCMFLSAALVAPHFGLSLLFVVPALQDTWFLSRWFFERFRKK